MLNSEDVLPDEIRQWISCLVKQTSHRVCIASRRSEEGNQHPATPS